MLSCVFFLLLKKCHLRVCNFQLILFLCSEFILLSLSLDMHCGHLNLWLNAKALLQIYLQCMITMRGNRIKIKKRLRSCIDLFIHNTSVSSTDHFLEIVQLKITKQIKKASKIPLFPGSHCNQNVYQVQLYRKILRFFK